MEKEGGWGRERRSGGADLDGLSRLQKGRAIVCMEAGACALGMWFRAKGNMSSWVL